MGTHPLAATELRLRVPAFLTAMPSQLLQDLVVCKWSGRLGSLLAVPFTYALAGYVLRRNTLGILSIHEDG
jgi:hypothetical protein